MLIRVDSSRIMGSGHLMRCLVLAESLRAQGYYSVFICRDYLENLISIIQDSQFPCITLPFYTTALKAPFDVGDDYSKWLGVSQKEDAQETINIIKNMCIKLLIVDHYALDWIWESELRPYVQLLMVIDDLANRKHDCDFLLDQNFYLNALQRYENLLTDSQTFLGPNYCLLKKSLLKIRYQRQILGKIDSQLVSRVLIFMGASDNHNITLQIISAIKDSGWEGHVDVVLGSLNPRKEFFQKECQNLGYFFYFQPSNYFELLVQADLVIGAGGTSTWERCCIGLPTITISIAENQLRACQDLHQLGIIYFLGQCNEIRKINISESFLDLIRNQEKRKNMINKGLELVDGKGAERVTQAILSNF